MQEDNTEFVYGSGDEQFQAPEDMLLANLRDNARKSWILRWYAEDFSWEGLANRDWFAPDPDNPGDSIKRTLQDYWRIPSAAEVKLLYDIIEAGTLNVTYPRRCTSKVKKKNFLLERPLSDEALLALDLLIEVDGRYWHAAHTPIYDQAGKTISTYDQNIFWFQNDGQIELFELRAMESQPQTPRHSPSIDNQSKQSLAQFTGCQFRFINVKAEPDTRGTDNQRQNSAFGAQFDWALFQKEIIWNDVDFLIGTSFQDACFISDARFEYSNFKEISFMDSVFLDEATFNDVEFEGDSFFDGTFIIGYTSFIDATFQGTASFDSVKMCGVVQFDGAFFKDTILFSDCLFVEEFSFEAVAAPLVESTDKRRMLLQTLFKDTVFLSEASFQNRLFTEQVDFSRASFYDRAKFYNCTFHPNVTFTPSKFHTLLKKNSVTFDRRGDPLDPAHSATRVNVAECPDGMEALIENKRRQTLNASGSSGWYGDREQDFRNLKDHMGKLSATTERQDFHALEIAARMRRTTGVTLFEKIIGRFYKVASNYGRDPIRPLIGIAAIFVISVLGTGLMADRLQTGPSAPCLFAWSQPQCEFVILPSSGTQESRIWKEVIAQNAQRTVFPVFRIKSEFNTTKDVETRFPLISTTLTLIQTGLSVVLIFLFLLTIKRRFQMS